MHVGVGVIAIDVGVVAVVVRVGRTRLIGVAVLGHPITAQIGRAREDVRIVVIAIDQPRRRVAARAHFLEAIAVGVASEGRAAFVDHAVAVVVPVVAELAQRAAWITLYAAAGRGGAGIDAGVVVLAIGHARRRIALGARAIEERVAIDVAGHTTFVDLPVAIVVDVVAADFLRAGMYSGVVIIAVVAS